MPHGSASAGETRSARARLRPTRPGRHPADREILRLAVPALGSLAAEPLYILIDTAVVGHLGTPELGGLAVAGTVLTTAFIAVQLPVLRHDGRRGPGGRRRRGRRTAARNAVQSLWLALIIGVALALGGLLGAPLLVDLMGPSAGVRPHALLYLRIASLGLLPVMLALVGVGYLRGLQDTVTPLRIALLANLANLVLELVAIYGLGMGLAASAWATNIAQVGAAVVFCRHIARHARGAQVSWRPDPATLRSLVVIGRDLFLRTGSLLAALAVATAVASRLGEVPLAAHQVAFQLWTSWRSASTPWPSPPRPWSAACWAPATPTAPGPPPGGWWSGVCWPASPSAAWWPCCGRCWGRCSPTTRRSSD